MSLISEFREFVLRGNVIDLAVAVVIGAAFGKIITALVDGIVMPVISMLTGGVSVADWKFVITPAQLDAAGKQVAAEVAIRYGMFFQTVIDFVLIALVIFMVLKAYNRMRAAPVAALPPEDVLLLREIRDSLRK
ncbi:large-conductance mechanosensitive channel protein MscL [Agrilutibacter solisilvae]|uniref:Large-conductance mechanosensitive channel n=1 Tax=Agrilutibacter solisilvae TaxID=2763317 RepID=A0A974XZR0_9GAMM|nr:large-conductance mechanosensitive channel protein MscL [Lysobacter solisilvae]QSX78613.1 large-conductance mechanosensitive channel protein MscL [Lysobacter solisilvae]